MILITGHRGFLGSHLMKALGSRAIGLDRKSEPVATSDNRVTVASVSPSADETLTFPQKCGTFSEWTSRLAALDRSFAIKTVVHAGAISDNLYKDFDIFQWNVYATNILLEMFCWDAHFIYISSQTANDPKTLYGHTKKMSELLIQQQALMDACIFQPFNIYGEDESMKPAHCQSLPHRLKKGNLEVLWDTCRDYIHVEDCVAAIKKAIESRTTGTYHLGTGIGTHSHALAERFDFGERWTYEERPPHIEYGNLADPEKFLSDWEPKQKIDDYCKS